MKKCPVDKTVLKLAYTKQGVEIDVCPQCQGIWLDKNELFLFTKKTGELKAELREAWSNKKTSERKSPLSGENMVELSVFDDAVQIDFCLQSEGMWFDKGELDRFPIEKCRIEIDSNIFGINNNQEQNKRERPRSQLMALPNLTMSSASVLIGMYAILTIILMLLVQFAIISVTAAFIVGILIASFQFLFGPFIMDISLRWFYKIEWVDFTEIPAHLQFFIKTVCKKENISLPTIGIINDGSPQAFTYGHHPNNGRIVISQGIMDLLTEEELEAVVAHEIGHMVHWDMLVMTLANLVPLLLYYIYRTLIRMRNSGRNKSAGARYTIAIVSYVMYIISEYVVLWFSRIREYYADRYSGQITGKPEALSSALVKIGYGLAGKQPNKESGKDCRSQYIKGHQPLGIFNEKHASSLAISGYSGSQKMGEEINKESLKDVAKWDLWNPWASYYEIHSTHPLIAKRINMLSNLSVSMGKPPYIEFNEKQPESYWDDFLIEAIIYLLPNLFFIAGLLFSMFGLFFNMSFQNSSGFFSIKMIALFLMFYGGSLFVKVLYMYQCSDFIPMNIKSLLKKIKVSAVHPIPCSVRGTIIGRGIPGYIFSEDLILKDDSGIVFLDYQQPLGFFNFIFAVTRAVKYKNQPAEVVGWYRRAPVPYIEIKELRVNGESSICFTYNFKIIIALFIFFVGIVLFFV